MTQLIVGPEDLEYGGYGHVPWIFPQVSDTDIHKSVCWMKKISSEKDEDNLLFSFFVINAYLVKY